MMDWSQVSVGVAAIVGLVYVAQTLRRTMRDVLVFLQNHVGLVTRTLEDLARSVHEMAVQLETLRSETEALHDEIRQREAARG